MSALPGPRFRTDHGQPGSYRFVFRVSTDKRACRHSLLDSRLSRKLHHYLTSTHVSPPPKAIGFVCCDVLIEHPVLRRQLAGQVATPRTERACIDKLFWILIRRSWSDLQRPKTRVSILNPFEARKSCTPIFFVSVPSDVLQQLNIELPAKHSPLFASSLGAYLETRVEAPVRSLREPRVRAVLASPCNTGAGSTCSPRNN
jgi:hypothetical protein